MKRRDFNSYFLKGLGSIYVNFSFLNTCSTLEKTSVNDKKIKISLAQWSLHRSIRSGKLNHLDFAEKARSLGFEAIEYVSQFFTEKVKDMTYLKEMNIRANDNGIKQLLIMVDVPENISSVDKIQRQRAVEKHLYWVDAAKYLNCHSIRVNLFGLGDADEIAKASIDGLTQICDYAQLLDINVLVENHGQLSSNGKWLADVIKGVGLNNCGTLPDLGNFCIEREGGKLWGAPCIKAYNKYKGVEELMPFAKAVSAKSFNFNAEGEEETIDYRRMMEILKKSNYTGYIGVEYEGDKLSEEEGILKTKQLIEKYIY